MVTNRIHHIMLKARDFLPPAPNYFVVLDHNRASL